MSCRIAFVHPVCAEPTHFSVPPHAFPRLQGRRVASGRTRPCRHVPNAAARVSCVPGSHRIGTVPLPILQALETADQGLSERLDRHAERAPGPGVQPGLRCGAGRARETGLGIPRGSPAWTGSSPPGRPSRCRWPAAKGSFRPMPNCCSGRSLAGAAAKTLSELAAEAWRLVHAYRIGLDDSAFAGDDQRPHVPALGKAVPGAAETGTGAVTRAELADLLPGAADRLHLVAFDVVTPQLADFLTRTERAGGRVRHHKPLLIAKGAAEARRILRQGRRDPRGGAVGRAMCSPAIRRLESASCFPTWRMRITPSPTPSKRSSPMRRRR